MKKILVLPAVNAQLPLLEKIHQMGFSAYTINPQPDSPGFAYSADHLQEDIFNYEKCLQYAEEKGVDAVVSDQCDIASGPVAKLCHALHLPGNSEQVIELFRDKSAMREFSKKKDLNCPPFQVCYTVDEAKLFFHSLKHKMIIKPLDSNSSRGVYTVSCDDDLSLHFEESKRWSIKEKSVLCEYFIDGVEFTIDGIKLPGQPHRCLAISEKRHFPHNRNIASSLYFSHSNPNYDYEVLKRLNNQYVDLSGLEFGLTHAEYKYENGKFFLIEIGARGGGNYISSHIVPCVSGVDNMGILIRMALGDKIDSNEIAIDPKLLERCAVLEFFDFETGKVKSIEGLDFLQKHPGILRYHFNFSVGDVIEKPTDDSKRVGYFIAYAATRQELEQLRTQIKENVFLTYF